MHEYALTKQLVNIVNRAAAEHNAQRVHAVYVVVGENKSVIPGSLELYFSMIAKGTVSEYAALHLRVVKPEMYCENCMKNFVRPLFSFACPHCGELGRPTEIGNEFYVDHIELEE